ncbi:phosphatidylinositol-3-phosphatase myotubularin-1-like [Lolium rigidum]|uniref:phosphatidylinositol-3-phosphatase myotubularin-1-like n=1 Tax=Lolium rigidum TaxID=89674 RepID=UPI001F5C79E1|nr:phosphatidylinositol-3-phosphatase myotubularin-1-like [Lolium rigidum]
MKLFLEHEKALDQGHSVTLLNTNEAGTLTVTNFRLIFVSKATECVVELGTIPLCAIEYLKDVPTKDLQKLVPVDRSIIKVTGHDMRVLLFSFNSENKPLKAMIENLKKCIKPAHLGHIYAFSCKPIVDTVCTPSMRVRLLKEYHRLFKKMFVQSASTCSNGQDQLQNKWVRVSELNSEYELCPSYPVWLIIPKSISDKELLASTEYRHSCRIPAISWFDPGSGAVLARSSQPYTKYLATTEPLLLALQTPRTDAPRKLYIVDARPLAKAFANAAKGGGTELLSYKHPHIEIWNCRIENIHAMAGSFSGLRDYVNNYGSISSDGTPLNQRDTISRLAGWSGRAAKSVAHISKLQTWLGHIHGILAAASLITAKITVESASVLVHCSDGWDRTSQLIGLSCLLLDPYYRTFNGFQALVEKDWLAFGHKFATRMGLPTIMDEEGRPDYNLPWNGDSLIPSKERSPVMLQWLECIAHLMCLYPCAFQFSSKFLVDFMDHILSCRFGNFLCNSEREREQADVASCPCIWKYLADLRASDTLHEHWNPFYDPDKHAGPIIPPAPALAPSLWPQFYLRWSCPLESHGGRGGFHELLKEKMAAEPIRGAEISPDENLPASGRKIRVVGSNIKKL